MLQKIRNTDDGLQSDSALADILGGDHEIAALADMLLSPEDTCQVDKNTSDLGGTETGERGAAEHVAHALLGPRRFDQEFGRLGMYRVLDVLGRGGMGVVFLAEHGVTRKRVALKILRPTLARNPAARARFRREVEIGRAIRSPRIVEPLAEADHCGFSMFEMPVLRGESLQHRLDRVGSLALDELVQLGIDLAAALADVHDHGVIHGDLKPDNIWLDADMGFPRLLDFGLARRLDEPTAMLPLAGSPPFMAPEQALGECVDERSDLFSLGTVLYRACTGRLPFFGDDVVSTLLQVVFRTPPSPKTYRSDLPLPLSGLIDALLEKDAEDRPPSAQVVSASLREIRDMRCGPEEPCPKNQSQGSCDAVHAGKLGIRMPNGV